jgi:hypothetical protein
MMKISENLGPCFLRSKVLVAGGAGDSRLGSSSNFCHTSRDLTFYLYTILSSEGAVYTLYKENIKKILYIERIYRRSFTQEKLVGVFKFLT